MKKAICISVMFFSFLLSVNAQQYVNVKQACPQCNGYGVVTTYYGPMYCPNCGGSGAVIITVPNPSYSQNISFQGAPNNGTYTRTNSSVIIYTESGHCKGRFSIYLHHGNKYIDFYDNWICIQGKNRFGYKGNWYVIKW